MPTAPCTVIPRDGAYTLSAPAHSERRSLAHELWIKLFRTRQQADRNFCALLSSAGLSDCAVKVRCVELE